MVAIIALKTAALLLAEFGGAEQFIIAFSQPIGEIQEKNNPI